MTLNDTDSPELNAIMCREMFVLILMCVAFVYALEEPPSLPSQFKASGTSRANDASGEFTFILDVPNSRVRAVTTRPGGNITWIGIDCTGGEYFTDNSNSVAILSNNTCFRADTNGQMCLYQTSHGYTFYSDACWIISSFQVFGAHTASLSGKCTFASGQAWNVTFEGTDHLRTAFVTMCFDEKGILTGSTSNLDGNTYVYDSIENITPDPSLFDIPKDCNCPSETPPAVRQLMKNSKKKSKVEFFANQ